MIELRDVTIRAGEFTLNNISLEVPSGRYAVLMGSTGRGKTTILEAICGLRTITSGSVLIAGRDVTRWPPGDRQIGYVPQDLVLFPTLTVAEHLAFALRLRKTSRVLIHSRVVELAEVLGITALLPRQVDSLSGGESQRVSLGRALSFRPSVLLLDEPLSALDDSTRADMQDLLKRVKQSTGVTTLHVTHNTEEAETLADVRLVLDQGQVQSRTTVADDQ
ncbi:ABC transporter ATP-binding protein [Neorhodopirellula pilleata]|uniref:Maltose/maltodextrin import ATP-binding protein MalK n=1 Tax=Neorhodopirellula pilleata TaxID=2714738 RepID=A0A5C5ZZY7_9BACT|nr:ABC transporter ATP-binding protein [Neorhodopirellula pilleata]TWT92630.1 Maltose/maltodextrin import ATP-binding protein MalK [Neorhodopirellula pilleata]